MLSDVYAVVRRHDGAARWQYDSSSRGQLHYQLETAIGCAGAYLAWALRSFADLGEDEVKMRVRNLCKALRKVGADHPVTVEIAGSDGYEEIMCVTMSPKAMRDGTVPARWRSVPVI